MLRIDKKKNYFEISDEKNEVFILTREYKIGSNVFIGPRTKISNSDGSPMNSLVIGDNVQIHHDTTIMLPSFSVFDYTKINTNFYAYGVNDLTIGYNCWFGSMVVADTLGGLEIKNNVCVASHSQIYSHAKFGDTLFGCRMNSTKKVVLSDDVWIAPNCLITMASMASKSMLLAGGVLSKDTLENHVYAGVPAKDISEKVGLQFEEKFDRKNAFLKLKKYLAQFYLLNPSFKNKKIEVFLDIPKETDKNISYFIISDRRYTKRGSDQEVSFMKFLLPEKGKFIPY